MAYNFKQGGIYSIFYSAWKHNYKNIIFVLYGNPVSPKLHALNLADVKLTVVDRAKLVHVIAKLSKIPNVGFYSGQVLYRIFLQYCKNQVHKCYKTYIHTNISSASLVNYGINKPGDYGVNDMRLFDPKRLAEAKKDFLVRFLDLYTHRGIQLKNTQETLAKIQSKPYLQPQETSAPGKPAVDVEQPKEEKTEVVTPQPEIPQPEPEGGNDEGGGGNYGY